MAGGQQDDHFDERAALEEIELYAELLIAVSTHDRPLTSAELDAALGLPVPSAIARSRTEAADADSP